MSAPRNQTGIGNNPTAPRANRTTPAAPAQSPNNRDPQEERIRYRAYLLAEAAGFPDGRADEFWHQAETEVRAGKIR